MQHQLTQNPNIMREIMNMPVVQNLMNNPEIMRNLIISNPQMWGIIDRQVYSNRAACYTKLGALPEGLKDAKKCIELDPTFSKGYTRKVAVQFFMKEYDKALETYQEGLKHDQNNQELLDGVGRCVEQINKLTEVISVRRS